MKQAVSPPLPAGKRGSYKCYVEADGRLHEVFWEGSPSYPDFNKIMLHHIQLSDKMLSIWSESELVGFGSNAVVRKCNNGEDLPIVKVAHPNAEARQLLQHEYTFMRELAGFPGARVACEPLRDHEGIYAFRMEFLRRIDFEEIGAKSESVRTAVEALHQRGFCHGDLSPSNVMIDNEGRLVLIDFSFAGRIGQCVPQYVPNWVYGSPFFDSKADMQRVARFFNN